MTTKQKPRVIVVPDVKHPTLCFKQTFTGPVPMARCNKPKGHAGTHSWDAADAMLKARGTGEGERDGH